MLCTDRQGEGLVHDREANPSPEKASGFQGLRAIVKEVHLGGANSPHTHIRTWNTFILHSCTSFTFAYNPLILLGL